MSSTADLDIQLRKDALPPNAEVVFKVQERKPHGEPMQNKRFFGFVCLGGNIDLGDRRCTETDLLNLLQEHGLPKTLPVTVDPRGVADRFYWQPVGGRHHCPSAWAFDWDGVPCSITGNNGMIDIRVHDMTPGTGERVIQALFDELYRRAPAPLPRTLAIYQNRAPYPGADHAWSQFGSRQHRSLKTLYLGGDLKARLVQQMKKFYTMEGIYDRYGLVWKRVHLFHGPPGSGKSSTVVALASLFGLNVAQLAITTDLDSGKLSRLFQNVPDKTCVLLEDVDALFVERHAETQVSFSALLNALDGIATKRGLVVFMTSNHLPKLDPALVRAGRVDCLVEFHLPGVGELRLALQALAPDAAAEHEVYLERNPGQTIAELQQHLFNCMLEERASIL
jgi:hypothetical protein